MWLLRIVPELCGWYLKLCEGNSFLSLCSKNLHYNEYIEKCIAGSKCSVSYTKHTEDTFHLSSSNGDSVIVSFEANLIHDELPSEIIFAQSVLKRIQFSSLAYGIVIVNKHITCITNEKITSKHDCVFERYTCDLDLPKKLGGFTLYTRYCSMYHKKTYPFYMLYCTNRSHSLFGEAQCRKLCIKDKIAS